MQTNRIVTAMAAAGMAVVLAAGCSSSAGQQDVARDADGNVIEGGEVGAFRLRVGDCFVEPGSSTEIESVDTVTCDTPHLYEVYAEIEIDEGPDADFPGLIEVQEMAGLLCYERFEGFVGFPYEESIFEISYVYPTEQVWEALNDRTVLCLIGNYDGTDKTGTARDAGQ